MGPARQIGSALLLATVASSAGAAGAVRLADLTPGLTTAPRVEDAVAAVLLVVGTATAGWYALTAAAWSACTACRLAGRRWVAAEGALARRGAPALRRVLTAALGATLGGAATFGVAAAATTDLPDDLGWRPLSAAPATDDRRSEPAAPATHVVRPGETLWGIADGALRATGRSPTTADTAAAWPRWYRANLRVIGLDPDLIRPGQVLTDPTTGDPS